ncbi:MAG: M3 family oligoendopeptidase [Chloroflexota bacterium]|nr:M3 family oligoendopeptidase [Chloroflexota bacterium]MDQ5865646.1 M3 family oligoendopeptidase [Chloroflexota bacterium]
MPNFTSTSAKPHRFVPDGFNPADPASVATMYDLLDERELPTRQALEDFILDWQELGAVLEQEYVVAYVDMTADTSNEEREARYIAFLDNILPVKEQRDFNVKHKIAASPAVDEIGPRYEVLLRNLKSEVSLFREENVPLLMEDLKLGQEYEKISGNETAEFQGKTYTLTQLRPFLEEPDRSVREGAWRARLGVRLADSADFDEMFDKMYEVRQQIARNAGFDNYRDYKFRDYKRFDYTPEDCMAFHAAVEKYIVPFMVRDRERRRKLLGVETIRPWDTEVDPEGRQPLRPFENVEQLKEGSLRVVRQVDPQLGEFLETMVRDGLLDLENRHGKAPGAYCQSFPDSRVPYIHMNAVGIKDDVTTLLHEGGHAFHYFLAREQPLHSYHFAGMEFEEVGSMSMELLARPYLGEFYSEEELDRLLDDQLRGVLSGMPWIAMLDLFQHWVYTAEDHGPEARRAKWREIEQRFRPDLDWSGIEQYRDIGWQYLHVFVVPFYYIEYGIAQIAALQVWLRSLEDPRGAIDAYKRGLSLGGSRPLPELFAAAGAEFDMGDKVVGMVTEKTVAQIKHK